MQLTVETFRDIVQSLRTDEVNSQFKERRGSPRVGVRGRVNIFVSTPTGKRTHRVMVRDISTTGIGLLAAEKIMQANAEFLLVLPSSEGGEQRATLCRVKRCVAVGPKQFLFGAAFARKLKI